MSQGALIFGVPTCIPLNDITRETINPYEDNVPNRFSWQTEGQQVAHGTAIIMVALPLALIDALFGV